jgi:hypothetical protein
VSSGWASAFAAGALAGALARSAFSSLAVQGAVRPPKELRTCSTSAASTALALFCSFFSSAPASLAYAAWSARSASLASGVSAAAGGAVVVRIPGLAWGAGVAACVFDSVAVGLASQAVAVVPRGRPQRGQNEVVGSGSA